MKYINSCPRPKLSYPLVLIFSLMSASFIGSAVYAAESAYAREEAGLINLDYKNAELSSVLRSLSYSYDLNLVTARDIQGKVNVSLRGVTIYEALEAILGVNGYGFTRKGNIIYITPGVGLEGIDTETVTVPVKYLPAHEAAVLLERTVSSRGDIRVNQASNSLVVTDLPAFIGRLEEALKNIDVPPVQVLIEAKLIDITESDDTNFGFTYTADFQPFIDTIGADNAQIAGGQTLAGPHSTLTPGQLTITAFSIGNLANATVTIDALLQEGKAHILASPSIATLNGQEARIIIGERFPYKEKTQTTTGTTETTKFVDIGTTLRVTPQVSPDGWITMIVHPEVSSLNEALDEGPRITTREADATIRVRDGETVVIGGLIRRTEDNIKSRIPILGHIPLLGWLFTRSSTDISATELVVFITPRIISDPEEAGGAGATRRNDVRVNIDGTGERVVVHKLWEEAKDLENNKGAYSRVKDKKTRMAAALDLYKQIASQFPGNEKADDALYRAGFIAYKRFDDLELAKRLFSRLRERYPDSGFRRKAGHMIDHINAKLAALAEAEKRKRDKE